MKLKMKQLVSMALAVCLLMSALPLYASAAVETQEKSDAVVYNFGLQNTDLVATDGSSLKQATLTMPKVQNALNTYYDNDVILWKYAADNLSTFKTDTNTVSNTFYFGGNTFKWSGLRLGMSIQEAGATVGTYAPGFWVAMTLKSPGAGKYLATLNYQTRSDATAAGEVYLFPGTYNTVDAVEANMTESNLLQTINFKGATSTFEDDYSELGMLNMQDGEYTIVFKSTKGSNSGAYIYINSLELLHESHLPEPPAPAQLDTGVYDFMLEKTDLQVNGGSFAAAAYNAEIVQTTLNKYYKDGKINWKYHSSYIPEGSTGNGVMFGGTVKAGTPDEKKYGWDGLRIYSTGVTTPVWYAFTIQSPGSGTYYPAFHYMKQNSGALEGSIYLLPGNTKDVAAAIAKGEAIGSVSYNNRKNGDAEATSQIFYDAPLKLTAGEEYIVVFTADKPSTTTGDAKLAYLYLNQFILYSTKTLPEKGPDVVTYDFDLYNHPSGEFTKGSYNMTDMIPQLENMYRNGRLNWSYENKGFSTDYSTSKFGRNVGMTVYTVENDWYAYRIKSPGQGTFTLSMNYSISGHGATGAVYILPADTTDIEKAMDHSNRVGKVAFYNDNGDTATTSGLTASLGTWEFGSEEEVIVVFEAYGKSPFSDKAYMYIKQLVATEGDHHVEADTTSKQVASVLLTDRAITVYEVTPYGAAANVNGVNYLFYCIEGCKMIMYNIDDMTKERVIQTPFIIARGMTVDKDGMIWVCGQSTVLFKYDPYTDVGMTTRTYGMEMPGCYGGFSMATDESGVLYMGSYTEGSVMKYVPATDEFILMGRYNDDGYFSCGAIVENGYLYIGVSGDTNGDGVRTTEILKIDTETYECVGRVDITEFMDPKENMVRGIAIGGDTLFVGGGTMTGFVAIDINTMELKHNYGFNRNILFTGSGVINGKLYFLVSGYGLQEYDIATDTITSMGLQEANYSLKCSVNSVVYLDDPLYPGASLVTFTAGGLVLYNLEQRRVDYFYIADEENDAAGTDILSITNGAPGSNEIFMGAFNTPNCAVYNTATGEWRDFEAAAQQTDAMVWYDGTLYTGNYTAGAITKINFENPDRNVVLFSMNNKLYEQNRVHAMTAGDGKVFAGTMPYSDTYGGAFVMIDLETLEITFERNIVQGQSVTGLLYSNGYVFGTTSTSGGTGTEGPESPTDSGKIFVYDVNKKEKVAELDLRKHISGLPETLPYVDAIAFDPNYEENGIFWGQISETLFTFTFDAESKTFNVKEYVSYSKTNYPTAYQRASKMVSLVFHNGYIYASLGNAGFRKISMTDPADSTRLNVPLARQFIVGEDNNLYLTTGKPELYVYPLDITDEDWAIAEAVDTMILQIGSGVTLENESQVAAALAAYEALPWRHKALIQNYEILDIAMSDLLELRIDQIGVVTPEKETLINDLYDQYLNLSEKQQKYVKNYDVLRAAMNKVQQLANAKNAAEVQKMIDALASLKPITLEDEAQVRAVREAVSGLKQQAKQLLDITLLVEAEAVIKTLRQEKVEYLKQLIASVGEVTLEDEAAITEAMDLYNWLYMDEREQVDYMTMLAANKALIKLQKEAAAAVDALILAIGDDISYDSKDAIEAARKAYDALTEGSKKYVTNLGILTEAEAIFHEIRGGYGLFANLGDALGIDPVVMIVIVAAVGVALLAGGAVVFVLVLKKKKATSPASDEAAAEEETSEQMEG